MLHFHIVTTDYMFFYHIALKNKIWSDGALWTSKLHPIQIIHQKSTNKNVN